MTPSLLLNHEAQQPAGTDGKLPIILRMMLAGLTQLGILKVRVGGGSHWGLCYPAKSEAIVLEAIAKNNTKARPENVYDCANKNGVSLKVKLIVGLV